MFTIFKMKKIYYIIACSILIVSCDVLNKPLASSNLATQKNKLTRSAIDLVNLSNDRIKVRVQPAPIYKDVATFYIPETVPGTYSDDDYGKFIDSVAAYGTFGKKLKVTKTSDNTWDIKNARNLDYIDYYVNDTYDVEAEHTIFSPAGTNFKENEQFMLNLHGILGYFKDQEEMPYYVDINRPETMEATTSLPRFADSLYVAQDFGNTGITDTYKGHRYFDIVDNPIMYNVPNKEVFSIDDITIELSVYSPSGTVKASSLKPNIERMIKAQKNYLGSFNATDRYTILLYLTTGEADDAQDLGALEHHTSTVVVLPESMPQENLDDAMVNVVSHEFFHIVTPLNLHATQIHKFKYNDPEMSMHLWMYEGITEYFAQHFQVQQGLVTPEDFYNTLVQKISNAKGYDDVMSFTKMSANILEEPYASNYGNVYEKGALIGMCLDILMRKNSNGERGVLDLMKELMYQYGPNRPFEDSNLIPQITQITYPEVGEFFTNHVIGTQPIQYKDFFDLVGLDYSTTLVDTGFLLGKERPYINGNKEENTIYVLPGNLNTFLTALGVQGNDVITAVNGTAYDLSNVYDLITVSNSWKAGDAITMTVQRDGKEVTLTGTVITPQTPQAALVELQTYNDDLQRVLREKWLKGS